MCRKKIMAFITAQEHCINIVNAAEVFANNLDCELLVVTVQPLKCEAKIRAGAVKCLENIVKQCNIPITVCYSNNPAKSLAAIARKEKPIHIFTGDGGTFLNQFRMLHSAAPISVILNQKTVCTIPAELDILKTAN